MNTLDKLATALHCPGPIHLKNEQGFSPKQFLQLVFSILQ
ncbi:MAG: hypothetical protein KatS3mg015_2644 [Fimbriimonadales bacterium]|nr:MAG: hypothetical protein KatS3mg015_2644 [Fimbriimonadales bacterium]